MLGLPCIKVSQPKHYVPRALINKNTTFVVGFFLKEQETYMTVLSKGTHKCILWSEFWSKKNPWKSIKMDLGNMAFFYGMQKNIQWQLAKKIIACYPDCRKSCIYVLQFKCNLTMEAKRSLPPCTELKNKARLVKS